MIEQKQNCQLISWIQFGGLAAIMIAATWTLFTHITEQDNLHRQEITAQSARSDRLYEMFYEVVKETRSK